MRKCSSIAKEDITEDQAEKITAILLSLGWGIVSGCKGVVEELRNVEWKM